MEWYRSKGRRRERAIRKTFRVERARLRMGEEGVKGKGEWETDNWEECGEFSFCCFWGFVWTLLDLLLFWRWRWLKAHSFCCNKGGTEGGKEHHSWVFLSVHSLHVPNSIIDILPLSFFTFIPSLIFNFFWQA